MGGGRGGVGTGQVPACRRRGRSSRHMWIRCVWGEVGGGGCRHRPGTSRRRGRSNRHMWIRCLGGGGGGGGVGTGQVPAGEEGGRAGTCG